MDASEAPETTGGGSAWSLGEVAFLVFLLVVLIAVSGLGLLSYREAMKTELTKRNGEQWAAWLSRESVKRALPGYEHTSCASGLAARPNLASEHEQAISPRVATDLGSTWGTCLAHLTTQTSFKDMRNPFTGKAPMFIAACNPADHSLVGSVAIEKVLANPPGSAIATVTSPFVPSDSIVEKVHLKISVCDKGAYAIKIAEIDF